MKSSRKKLFHIITVFLVIGLFALAVIVQHSMSVLNMSVDNMSQALERSEREAVSNDLMKYTTLVETSLTDEQKTNGIPVSVFEKYLNTIDSKYVSDIMIVNSGFSVNYNNSNIEVILNSYDKEYRDMMKEQINAMIIHMSDDNDTTQSVKQIITETSRTISKNTGYRVSESKIYNDIVKSLLSVNHIVLNTQLDGHKGVVSEKELTNMTSDNSIVWTEWVTIPEGHLGLNDESALSDGIPNVNYKKYTVLVQLDKEGILSNMAKMQDNINFIGITLMVVFICISILAMVLTFIQFYKKVNGGVEVEPIIRTNSSNHDDDLYKLLRRFKRGSKQLRKGQDEEDI